MSLEHEYRCTFIGGVLNLYLSITAMQRAANLINIFQLQAQRIPSVKRNTKMKRSSQECDQNSLAGRVLHPDISLLP